LPCSRANSLVLRFGHPPATAAHLDSDVVNRIGYTQFDWWLQFAEVIRRPKGHRGDRHNDRLIRQIDFQSFHFLANNGSCFNDFVPQSQGGFCDQWLRKVVYVLVARVARYCVDE
jgi:hypothetical protein